MMFVDRRDAGRRLARRLLSLKTEGAVVLGLPRGGVPVAAEVAEVLHAPLDVLVVRKLGCPWQPELGFGAVAEGGVRVLNDQLVGELGLTNEDVEGVTRREQAELERRVRTYRRGRPPVPVERQNVVLVDDGIATGSTVRSAVQLLRQRGARRVLLATPVAPREAVEALWTSVDGLVVLETPDPFWAIGQWYLDFGQTTDEEVIALLDAAAERSLTGREPVGTRLSVEVTLGEHPALPGDLHVPLDAKGLVIFAHGSGSSRHSPRNRQVATALNSGGLATLLFDLLAPEEEMDRANVFDVGLLADRLVGATRWIQAVPECQGLPVGYFGASTGAGAAVVAAAELGHRIRAIVSRGGRPDLAMDRLAEVTAPTLLIVGGRDETVLRLNQEAQRHLRCESRLDVVPGATHLFEERGALDTVAELARVWFEHHLTATLHPAS